MAAPEAPSTEPAVSHRPSVLVVGGGPGGIAAGIWAVRLGLHPVLLEARGRLGGQLLSVASPITDYPGIQGVDGPALAARFIEHLEATRVSVRLDTRVERIDPVTLTVTTDRGQQYETNAIIIATGALRRRLGLEDESRLAGHGVSYSVSADRQRATGRVAVIAGGGDSAVEGAALLGEICPEVHLVHRSPLSARPDFVARVHRDPRVTIHSGRQIVALLGEHALEAVRLDDGTRIECAWLFVRIGVAPVTGFARPGLPCDDQGFLLTDASQQVLQGIYAVGDVCSPKTMAVSVATGQAMIACKHIQNQWRASR